MNKLNVEVLSARTNDVPEIGQLYYSGGSYRVRTENTWNFRDRLGEELYFVVETTEFKPGEFGINENGKVERYYASWGFTSGSFNRGNPKKVVATTDKRFAKVYGVPLIPEHFISDFAQGIAHPEKLTIVVNEEGNPELYTKDEEEDKHIIFWTEKHEKQLQRDSKHNTMLAEAESFANRYADKKKAPKQWELAKQGYIAGRVYCDSMYNI